MFKRFEFVACLQRTLGADGSSKRVYHGNQKKYFLCKKVVAILTFLCSLEAVITNLLRWELDFDINYLRFLHEKNKTRKLPIFWKHSRQ